MLVRPQMERLGDLRHRTTRVPDKTQRPDEEAVQAVHVERILAADDATGLVPKGQAPRIAIDFQR